LCYVDHTCNTSQLKKIKPDSEVASKAILSIVESFRRNSQNYIKKEGISFFTISS